MSKRNRYSKALKHLKSTQIEEKIRCLDEALPTNHTKGLYSLNPPGFRVGRPDPIKTFYPDSDGNWPSGIPGTEGELTYDRPAGFWSGERNWDHITISNMSQDYLVDDPDGKSTAGVIAADGTVLAGLPPGGESFILGPLVDGWTRNHVYDAFTQIGYIQKDTRQFVALGRIEGQWKVDLHGSGYAVWDGTSTGFTSYNENFTLAMAQWARQQIIDNNYVDNIPYFYSGGTPQQPLGGDTCPNCPEGSYGGHGFAPLNPADFGSGGDSDDITIGTDQPPPASGDATDAGYPAWGGLKDGIKDFIDNIFGSGTSDGISDAIDGLTDTATGISDFIDGITDAFGDGIVRPLGDALDALTGTTNNVEGTTWGKLAGSIARSIMDPITYAGDVIFKGLPQGVDYLPDFKGAGPKWAGGKKITDMLGGLFGKDVQYFTPDLDTAIKYAGEGGSVVAMPRPETGVRGMKNWLGSTVSRGFDPTKGVEQIVKTSDSVAAANLTKVIPLADEGSSATLKALAAKGATTNKVLSKLGKAVPFLNVGLVVADVTNRMSKGDYAGALLGGIQIIPGPVGWVALGSQIAYDVSGSKKNIPWNKPVSEAVNDSSMSDNMGAALIEMGLPKDKNEFIKEMGFYLMLQGQIAPEFLSMMLRALQGEELSTEEKKWMDENFETLINGVANRKSKTKKESFSFGKLRKVQFVTETASAAPTSTASTPTNTSTSTESSSSDLKPIADNIAGEIVDKKGPEVASKVSDGLKDYADENDIPPYWDHPENSKTDKLYPNVAKGGWQTHFDNPEYVKAMVEYEKWHNPKIRAEYERKNDWLKKNFTVGPENSTYKWVTNYHRKFVASSKELRLQWKNAVETYGDSKPEETKPEETKPWWDRDDGDGELSDTDYASAAAATAERKKKKDFEARMAALDAEIAGYDAAVKAAHAEMRNIVIQFGIDAALTIFGGALLKGGASAIKALRGYSALSKAQKAAKTQKAWNALAKPQPKPWTSSSYNPNKPLGGPARKRFPVGDSYEPKGRVITESSFTPRQRKILREIKNPIEIKEAPKKYKMNFAGKYSSQNTPDKTASAVSDALVASGNARGQRWRTEDKYWQGYETTERMNIIYDRLGHGSMAWDRTIAEAQRKNGWRTREIQEQLNICAHEKAMRNIDPDYQSPWSIEIVETTDENEKRFDKVNKIKQVVSQGTNKRIAAGQRNVAPEYPDQAPPEMVNGWHPKLATGQDISNRYNKLDPQSAEAMPKTGNPHIDSKVEKAKKRFPKGKSNKPYLESRNFFSKRFKEYRLQEQLVNWTGGVYTQLQGPTGPVDVSSSDGGEEATYSDFTQGSTTHNSLQSVELAPRGAGTNASDGFSIGPESGNAYLGFDGQTMVGEDRVAILDPIDATKLDTIMIQVIVGNNSNGGTTPTYASDGAGLGLEWYPPNGYSPFAGGGAQDVSCPWYAGVDEDDVMVLYDADTDDQKGYVVTSSNASSSLKTYTVSIPPHLRRANLAIGIKQYGEWNSEEKELNYGVSRISYQNRTISSVQSGISLDTPGASAFIRVGQGTRKTDPKKRRKEVFEKLQASRKYTDKQFGKDFPGSGAQLVGDDEITPSPTTSQQVRDAWGGAPQISSFLKGGSPPPGYQAKVNSAWSSLNNEKKSVLARLTKSMGSGVRDIFAVSASADGGPNFGAMTDNQFQDYFNQALGIDGKSTPVSDYPFHGEWTDLFDSEMKARVNRAYSSLSSSKKDILTRLKDDPRAMIFALNTADPSIQGYMEFIDGMSDSQFHDYLTSGSEPLKQQTSSDSEPLKQQTSSDSEPWSMDIQVGDERVVKKGQGQSGTTVLDTQRGIDNTKPQTVPSDSYVAGVDYKQPSASDRGELTKTDMATVRPTQIKKAIKDTPEVANAFSKLGTAGKTYVDYLTGNLPKVIDNKYLGKSYVNSIFKNAQINDQGTVTAGDNIVGTGGKAKYNSKTGEVSIPFNYDFKPNEQEFNDPSKAGQTTQFQRAVLNALGPYSADAQIPMPTPLQPLQTLSGVIAGGGVALAKQFGGAKHTTGRVTMPASKLKRVNPSLYNQVVKESLNESRLKSPKQFFNPDDIKPEFPNEPPPEMINGYHPHLVDGQEISNRYNKLDPTSAKAMPKTGNPHIDAKVEKAKNNPDKDGPKWRKMVDAKARKARLQRG